MTAVAVPVPPAKDASLRPLPWRRMVWVAWRHHRIALGGVVVFLGVLALWLWTTGLQLHHAYATAIAATLAAYTALALLAGNVLRQHYLTPLVANDGHLPGAAWVTSEWWTKGGKFAFSGRPRVDLLQQLCPSSFITGPGGQDLRAPVRAEQLLRDLAARGAEH